MGSKENHIVLGCRPWSREIFDAEISRYPGTWHYVSTPEELVLQEVAKINPRTLFFLHWSWKVPQEIVERFECVGFHPTDLPFGRGGTPIQNLILRGLKTTKLSAFRMTNEMDAGPIYLKEDFSLEGSAEAIFVRMSRLASQMIKRIIIEEPTPTVQKGKAVLFKRRNPEESKIPHLSSLEALYDFIRMLDARDYPKAFFHHEGFCYELRSAKLSPDKKEIETVVKIRRAD